MVEVEVYNKKAVEIPNGSYEGVITEIGEHPVETGDKRRPTAQYVDFSVRLTDSKLPKDAIGYILKDSMPGRVTPNSELGKFVKKAGLKVPEGEGTLELAPLIGKKVIILVGKRNWEKGGASGVAPDIKDIEFVNTR